MPRQANGTYIQPANTAAVSGQSISSVAFNTLETDIGTEITNSVDRGGRSAMTAALPMGGQKITGMADPTVATDGATKNYVDTTTAAFFSTGDVKLTIKTAADTGWVLLGASSNGSIGNAGSGSTIRANIDCLALFTLFFNNYSDANAPLLTSGGGATTRAAQTNAGTAWAALCRMQVGFFADRALGVAGNPPDLPTNRTLGDHPGAETSTLVTANLPPYSPAGSVSVLSTVGSIPSGATNGNLLTNGSGGFFGPGALVPLTIGPISSTGTLTGTAQGGTSTPISIIQPISFLNAMIKL